MDTPPSVGPVTCMAVKCSRVRPLRGLTRALERPRLVNVIGRINAMPKELHAAVDEKALATVVAAAEPTRLTILFLLGKKGRMCVGDIARRFKASRPAISHHLKVLKNCSLVQAEREGQEIYYFVHMDRVVDTLRALADSLDQCCGRGSSQRRAGGAP